MKLAGTSLVQVGLLAVGVAVSTGTAQQAHTNTAPPVNLPNTHVHVLHSKINGRAYLIEVALPSAYVGAKPGDLTRYPTLYLLDGVWDFPLLFSYMQFAAMAQPTRTILVGVAAADSQAQWRRFDYTPPLTNDSVWGAQARSDSARMRWQVPVAGGAPQFLRVLKEEVIPLIDNTYRTSGDRGIEGSSFGGLFVAYTILEEPDLFTRYAMISPSLWWDNRVVLAREPEFARRHPTFRKQIFLSVGSVEDPNMIAVGLQFVGQLCTSISNGYYEGLDLGAETLPGEPHGSPAARVHVLAALYSADSTGIKPGRGVMRHCR
jgi:predicted alpha/beta superfamily hydrolase